MFNVLVCVELLAVHEYRGSDGSDFVSLVGDYYAARVHRVLHLSHPTKSATPIPRGPRVEGLKWAFKKGEDAYDAKMEAKKAALVAAGKGYDLAA